ncbi:MAG: dihydrodipicolinate synthase family protein [Chloroflexota bacterium]
MIDTPSLLDALDTSVTIPVIPFKDGAIDFDGHAKNISYLMNNNYLKDAETGATRPRVISVAGTSLIHHISPAEQTQIFDVAGQTMGSEGILMSAIAPNPISVAGSLVEEQSKLQRPPDVYLIMPLAGTASPEGVYESFMEFGEKYGTSCGARFIYYFRQPREREAVIRLLNDSPHFVGVKIGTTEDDVPTFIDGVGDNALVIWGIGDRSSGPAEKGAKGHTSGIAVLCARASDEINNANRRGDYDAARAVEAAIAPLEEIRFYNGRIYNYSAVVEVMNLSGFDDIVGGEGGPFNPKVPADVSAQLQAMMPTLVEYH